MAKTSTYHPEEYWSEVAEKISSRDGHNVLAGDDSPFYRYKRKKFLSMLSTLDFKGKNVMELGSGPGGNIKEILKFNPATITGADISQNMIDLASSHLKDPSVSFKKINGEVLPFEDGHFDIVFCATVLQHNTDDDMMRKILKELARVSGDKVYLFERIESNLKGDDLCMGRPVNYYRDLVEEVGFELVETKFINIQVSYWVCGIIRKLLNPSSRKEGQSMNKLSIFLQSATLPFTSILDKVFVAKRDLGQLVFQRK